MRHSLAIALLVLLAGACDQKGKSERKIKLPPEAKAAAAAFEKLQAALHKGDAETAWSLYSVEMKEGMALKIRTILDIDDQGLESRFGITRAELEGLGITGQYRKLITAPETRRNLEAEGKATVYRVHREREGRMQVFFRSKTRECSQAFTEHDGKWLADQSPSCKKR